MSLSARQATSARLTGACALRSAQEPVSGSPLIESRRGVVAAGLAFLGGAVLPKSASAQDAAAPAAAAPAAAPAPAAPAKAEKKPGDKKFTGDYVADVTTLLDSMEKATGMKKGDPAMKDVVTESRKDMNDFVAFYRRNTKVAGAASFSTLYTAISTLSGHFQNYGNEYPVPAKRQKRLNQQYTEIKKAISRGR